MKHSRILLRRPRISGAALASPFDGLSPAYQHWRAIRLAQEVKSRSNNLEPTVHQLAATDRHGISGALRRKLCESIRLTGYVLYTWTELPSEPISAVNHLHQGLNLRHYDTGVVTIAGGLSLLEDLKDTAQGRFIPYSNRAMNWHTDGYYNSDEQVIRCFSLHCVEPALSGGRLTMMDYELLLIALFDDDPDLVSILAHPEAMLLPGNRDKLGHDRPDRPVPMIFTHSDGSLGMRFTARTKHIVWRTPETEQAARRALAIIEQCSTQHISIRLKRGQGLITRNILHRRDAFTDSSHGPKRQVLRGRFTQLPGDPEASPSQARGDSNAPCQ